MGFQIDDTDHTGLSQEAVHPLAMAIEQTKQARPMGQVREQMSPIGTRRGMSDNPLQEVERWTRLHSLSRQQL